ncbi:MAG: Peptide deformylase [Devosia sp.]|nr:Peptide deformylase [Devosia sp.]
MPDFVIYPHVALSVKAMPRAVDAAMLAAGADLLAAAQKVQAYGLAAAHLGLDQPLVVISTSGDTTKREYCLLFNPEILQMSDETDVAPEGSVSMPGIEAPVKRSRWVELAFDDADGQRNTQRFERFVARVAQHEIDQMNGLFFLRRISTVKRDIAIRKFRKSLDG